MKIATMVRGYVVTPRPRDIIYAPLDLAYAISKELAARGHSIDYFAPMGSKVEGTRVQSRNLRALVTDSESFQATLSAGEELNHYRPALWDNYLVEDMFKRARLGEYDLLHFHHPEVALSLAQRYPDVPVVYTLHDPTYPWYKELYEMYSSPNQHFISISNNQRKDAPDLNYAATVYNGIDMDDFEYSADHEDYLLYTGRIVPEKGVKEAIQVAQATNHRLLIIGPVYPASQGYFDQYIKPQLDDKILYLGYIEREKMQAYYQKAKAVLLPIQWEEPFGLTAIEAMACGTPTIAIKRGSMPEIIKDGVTGYLVASIGEMIEAVGKINKISRHDCRDHAKAHFSVRNMVDGYEAAYKTVLQRSGPARLLRRRLAGNVRKRLNLTTDIVRRLPKQR